MSNISASSEIEPMAFASTHSAGLTYLQPETQDSFLNSRILSAFDASSGAAAAVNNPFVSVAEPVRMSSPMWNNSSSLATSQGTRTSCFLFEQLPTSDQFFSCSILICFH